MTPNPYLRPMHIYPCVKKCASKHVRARIHTCARMLVHLCDYLK